MFIHADYSVISGELNQNDFPRRVSRVNSGYAMLPVSRTLRR